jgi:DNA-directed RNA polymerase sigma subunit (sigma70/sigma32)
MQKGRDLSADVVTMTEHVATNPLDLEHLVNTLSKYLRPKEMEALCWRYGLFPEGYQRKQPPQKQQRSKTDYLAKVEAELFCSEQDPQQQLVVGGKWGEAMSFTEVGKHMQVSAEYGRKLCHAALEKLRRAAEEGRLEPALLMSC